MHNLFISPSLKTSGNLTTAQRIQSHFPKGFCILKSFLAISNIDLKCKRNALNTFCHENDIISIIFIHAYKCSSLLVCTCGRQCESKPLSYSVIFGGTDLNEDIEDLIKLNSIINVIKEAKYCVAFNEDLKQRALKCYNSANVVIQPQALPRTLKFDTCITGTETSHFKLFVLIAGIRPVKDPIFILESFKKLASVLKSVCSIKLLIIGPNLDENYFDKFSKALCHVNSSSFTKNSELGYHSLLKWLNDQESCLVRYMEFLSHTKLMNLLQSGLIFCSLNTSLSEGMCISILEAMMFKIPVLARDIPGNSDIIKDGENGLLFASEEEFVSKAIELVTNESLRNLLIKNAEVRLTKDYSIEKEKQFYLKYFYD